MANANGTSSMQVSKATVDFLREVASCLEVTHGETMPAPGKLLRIISDRFTVGEFVNLLREHAFSNTDTD